MELQFTKMHGLGNDFIVVDDRDATLDLSPEAVEWFCDRNFGIGADGIMLVRPATVEGAHASWWFRNADGSVAEMCGNGIRCFAKFLVDREIVARDVDLVHIETSLGVYDVSVVRAEDGTLALATVDMGTPILDPREIPTTLGCETSNNPVVDCEIMTTEGPMMVTCVSMGNPHCVIFVDDIETAPVHTVGPELEENAAFPHKTNVEFAQLNDDGVIRLRVWERGVGETLACGTGACAATVAAALACRGGRSATVELPGGSLDIRWMEDGRVSMTGPAEEVFTGILSIPEDDE